MRAALSCNEVASTAIIPELTSDYHERTVIVRYRAILAWAAGLLLLYSAYALFLVPSATQPIGQLNREGYENYAIAGSVAMLVAIMIAAVGTHGRIAKRPTNLPAKQPALAEFRNMIAAFSNRAFLILMLATMFAFLNQGITFAMTNYLMTYVWLLSPKALSIYPMALFVGATAGAASGQACRGCDMCGDCACLRLCSLYSAWNGGNASAWYAPQYCSPVRIFVDRNRIGGGDHHSHPFNAVRCD